MSIRIATGMGLLSAAIILSEAQPTEGAKIRCSMKMGCMQMSDLKAPVAGKNCIAVPRGCSRLRVPLPFPPYCGR